MSLMDGQNRRTFKDVTLNKISPGIPTRCLNAWKLWNKFKKGEHLIKITNNGQIPTVPVMVGEKRSRILLAIQT